MPYLRTLLTNKKLLAMTFVLLGSLLIAVYSWRSVRAYQQWQYIQEQGIDQGNANVGAIRAWMTMRYVSVAYGVPQQYIFAELAIPYNRQNSNITLSHLTHIYSKSPQTDSDDIPILVIKVADIIQAYRENPVVVGLKDIRPWMTLQYISNSTGIPVVSLFTQLDIAPQSNNEFKSLKDLAREVDFPGGGHGLIDTIKEILTRYQGEQ